MMEHPRPRVAVSRCLGFAACRYNGEILPERFLDRLSPFVEFVPVCPEVEIGLGTPREPVRLVTRGAIRRLVQPATGRDLTASMRRFSARFLDGVGEVDGFILKSRSPSCALTDAKHYAGAESSASLGRTSGFFGAAVGKRFGHLAVEDEARLLDPEIREHFLRKLFSLARLRELKSRPSRGRMVEFHASHKLLLLAGDEEEMRRLGRIVANPDRLRAPRLLERYEKVFPRVFERPPRRGPTANALQHAFGHFSGRLTGRERRRFLKVLESYRKGKGPIAAPRALLRSWIERFGDPFLERQVFFEPFPRELDHSADSKKGPR